MINNLLRKLLIRHKLIILNLLITGIVFLLAAIVLFVNEYFTYKDLLLQNLISHVKILASNSTASLAFNDQKAAGDTLGALKESPNIECAVIYARDGSVFATYWRAGERKTAPPSPSVSDRHFFSKDDLIIFQGIILDRERIGTIYLRSDFKKLYSLMMQDVAVTLITFLIVFAIAYILMSKWQLVITEPIFNLLQSMKIVSRDKNYALKARIYSEDEIGSLAEGFNEMLEQIQHRDTQLRAEIVERKRAEEEVRTLNEGLEMKVAEKRRQLVEAQEELVRKEKLAILGQLSGSVGHELRNPLGVMNNAVYFLKSVLAGADETVREYLDIIKKEIDNSERIITDLLDFARTKTPQAKAVMVCALIEGTLSRCTVSEKVDIQCEIPVTLPPLKVDPLQIGQVLQNLISNAVQAMPEGGILRISARKVRGPRNEEQGSRDEERGTEEINLGPRTSDLEPDFIEISMTDSGGGITPENMKRLFHPLFTTKAKGIGLGLTVCRNLTEANGGRIAVESVMGKGTTFTIILPTEG